MFDRIMTIQSRIGTGETTSRWRIIALGLTAAAVVYADAWLVWTGKISLMSVRPIPPVIALMAYCLLLRGDLPAMDLRFRPIQGFRYWVLATVWIGAAIGTFLLLALAAALLTGYPIRLYRYGPPFFGSCLSKCACFRRFSRKQPYRFGLCAGLVTVIRPRPTIFVSRMIFGAIHILYGNPGPNNLIAGYFLGLFEERDDHRADRATLAR